MRVVFSLGIVAAITVWGVMLAAAPLTSPRPKPRELREQEAQERPKPKVSYRATIRPKPRVIVGYVAPLKPVDVTPEIAGNVGYALASTRPVYRSPRPLMRPASLGRGFTRKTFAPRETTVKEKPHRTASTKPTAISGVGVLCGDARIQGERMAPVAGTLPGCGIADPVRVYSLDGVALSQKSVMDCTTAKALRGWVTGAVKPQMKRRYGKVKSLTVLSQYSCRTRNSKPGAKISEHGKGRAIDIGAFTFADGTKLTVKDGWKSYGSKKILRRLQEAACGPFGTVLGPDADKFHRDHFHMDTARYRGGAYCR
ncbi:MAG: extensin family protein [Alphaproteobacteria bacterium]|nr:extensin family protein [Alphaproteobacteria bacterium]